MRLRLVTTLAALTTLSAATLGAQEAKAPIRGLASPPRPAEVVAQRASRALAAPEDGPSWKALASSLADMAVMGDADVAATFDAAHVADSLAAIRSEASTTEAGAAPVASEPARARRSVRALLGTVGMPHGMPDMKDMRRALEMGLGLAGDTRFALPTLAFLFSLLLLLRMTERRKVRRKAKGKARAEPERAGRVWTALTLASGGVDVGDISRRTGLAREAVNMAVRMVVDTRYDRRGVR